MVNPQPTDAHLRIAHSILEAILLRDFSKRQLKILFLILRLSWGCRGNADKKVAIIPKQKDFKPIGIGETHIKVELEWLVASKVIIAEGDKYWFNKNFDDWEVSRVNPYEPDKLTDLVSLNIKDSEKLTDLVSSQNGELTEKVSGNLPKREETTYQKGNFPTRDLASPKEILNKDLNKHNYRYRNKGIRRNNDPDKYWKGKYGHLVQR